MTSEEQLTTFMKAIKTDSALQEKIKNSSGDPSAIVAIANEAGFEISTGQAENLSSDELSDEDLERVAGGQGPKSSERKIFDRRAGIVCA